MTDQQEELNYTLEVSNSGTKVKSKGGNTLFSLDDSFTPEQCDKVFQLCDHFFSRGVQLSSEKLQSQARGLFGFTPEFFKTLSED